jgi:DNA modification methylase
MLASPPVPFRDASGTLSIEYIPVADLHPHPNNPRTHTEKQIGQIARSIEQFGFVNPVLTDQHNNIIAGHGRVEAAKRLGMRAVPAVRVEHLTPAQRKAYIIADNQLATLAGWDKDLLKIEVLDIIELDSTFELEVIGLEPVVLDQIMLDGDTAAPEEDPTALLRPDPVSRKGDLWILGDHRLLCGDALKPEDYARLMGGEKARAVFTDPPYNVKVGNIVGNGKTKHAEFAMASGEMSRKEFVGFLKTSSANVAAFLADGGIAFLCMDWKHIDQLLEAGNTVFSALLNICVWNKTNGGMGSLYRSKHELIAVFRNGAGAHINNIQLGKHGRYRTNVWDYAGQNSFHADREEELGSHPTVKPIALVADALLDVSHRGDIVLDPFGGSGSTLLAAEKTGRKARLIEFEPVYVDLTIRRWQALTGQQAVHADTRKTFDQTPSMQEENA